MIDQLARKIYFAKGRQTDFDTVKKAVGQRLNSFAAITKNDIEQVEISLIGTRLKERVKTPPHPNYFKNLERKTIVNAPGEGRKQYKKAMYENGKVLKPVLKSMPYMEKTLARIKTLQRV